MDKEQFITRLEGAFFEYADAEYAQRMFETIIAIAAPVVAARTDWAAINFSALTAGLFWSRWRECRCLSLNMDSMSLIRLSNAKPAVHCQHRLVAVW